MSEPSKLVIDGESYHVNAGTIRNLVDAIKARGEQDAKRYADSEKLQAIGKSAFESIAEMVAALECDYDRLAELRAIKQEENWEGSVSDVEEFNTELTELEEAAGDCTDREDAETRIMEDPLSIELSGTWVIGETPLADKAIILLGTGGPAVRIVCELDGNMEPRRAFIQTQDWFLPWADYIESGVMDTLLTYCRCFYFGEG